MTFEHNVNVNVDVVHNIWYIDILIYLSASRLIRKTMSPVRVITAWVQVEVENTNIWIILEIYLYRNNEIFKSNNNKFKLKVELTLTLPVSYYIIVQIKFQFYIHIPTASMSNSWADYTRDRSSCSVNPKEVEFTHIWSAHAF